MMENTNTEVQPLESHQEVPNDSTIEEAKVENIKPTITEELNPEKPPDVFSTHTELPVTESDKFTSETDKSSEKTEPSTEQSLSDNKSSVTSSEKVVDKKLKIDVLLKAAGDAPIMKKKKWAVDADKPVAYLSQFIRKYIKCDPSESLFIYVNQTFVPSPDQVLSNLFECFGSDGKLILHYCKSQAWG